MTISNYSRQTYSYSGTPSGKKDATRLPSPSRTSTSYAQTATSNSPHQKVNIVTRVVIEGRAKQGQDGAAIKMYLKLSVPPEHITQGSTIPLFSGVSSISISSSRTSDELMADDLEENVKVLASEVHPLSSNSVPYNFSSKYSPLLHNAARALCLPARSSQTFYSAFHLMEPTTTHTQMSSASRTPSVNGISSNEDVNVVDPQYTGHILVSRYYIAYVPPKALPEEAMNGINGTKDTGDSASRRFSRRTSFSDRNHVQFMAAIDMWVPYVLRPPRAPYLLSIPLPRCLNNSIKLRMFPPTATSSSFASLSSIEEESNSWDLTSDPHVSRSTSMRPSRSISYTHFADDESSDSSTAGFADGCGIQGSFPSSERIRIRWAKPFKRVDIRGGDNGRRRVGVKEVQGEMSCIIRDKRKNSANPAVEAIVMDVSYNGSCKGVWFPGVATQLGMDIALEAKGCEVTWVDDCSKEWNLSGGTGYTGFNVAGASTRPKSDQPSREWEFATPQITPPPSNVELLPPQLALQSSRHTSTSSVSSLLRAPLPSQNIGEYSFEGSGASSFSQGPLSSVSSFPDPPLSASEPAPPGAPITLHLNMNDIVQPAKNVFTFSISGTILVSPRHPLSKTSRDGDGLFINLPRFTVLAADTESTFITVRNELDAARIEVYDSTGDINKDAQARKAVLQRGGHTRCAEDGGRIVIRHLDPPNAISRSLHASSLRRVANNMRLANGPAAVQREVNLMMTSVNVVVTPLVSVPDSLPESYFVRIRLRMPTGANLGLLEFGFARPFEAASPETDGTVVSVVNVSTDSGPIQFEYRSGRPETVHSFEEVSAAKWMGWAKIPMEGIQESEILVDYVATRSCENLQSKCRARILGKGPLQIYLPIFSIPIEALDITVDEPAGLRIAAVDSNARYRLWLSRQCKLLDYSLHEFSEPRLSLIFESTSKPNQSTSFGLKAFLTATCLTLILSLISMYQLSSIVNGTEQSLEKYLATLETLGRSNNVETVTVTATINTGATTLMIDPTSASEFFTTSSFVTRPIAIQSTMTELPSATESTGKDYFLAPSEMVDDDYPDPGSLSLIASPFSIAAIQKLLLDVVHSHDFHSTVDVVKQAANTVWQVFRKIYHYPLDPP